MFTICEVTAPRQLQSWSHYQAPGRAQFVRDVEARLAALPGVRAAGAASSVPLMEGFGAEQSPLAVVGEPPAPAGASEPIVQYAVVTPGLFRALAVPLRHGRVLDGRDRDGGAPVALVNEAFVRRHLPAGDPIGRRLVLARLRGAAAGVVEREIVGVVGDVRRFALHESVRPTVYLPHAQVPTGATAFVVWGADRPSDLVRQAKQAIWDVNPAMAIYGETTMDALVGASLQQRRFLLALLTGFAALALVLAAAGLYGLMSYVTAQRTREFGVRLALGAARGRVVSLVLRRGLALAAAGILLGLAGAVAGARLLAGMLYRVTPFDPLTFLAAAVVLVSAAAAASAVPAWRAAATDPITALREE